MGIQRLERVVSGAGNALQVFRCRALPFLTNVSWFYWVDSTQPSILQAFGGAGGFFAGVVGILVRIDPYIQGGAGWGDSGQYLKDCSSKNLYRCIFMN